ncbi:MAG: 5-formyltetrahydrofolate cyclo-ligase [Propionibacterium acidifaciens]
MSQLDPDGRTARSSPLDAIAAGDDAVERKEEVRRAVRRARGAEPRARRLAADEARAARALALVHELLAPGSAIACYLSTNEEPGTLGLVEALRARGHRVLAPVLGGLPDGRPRHDVAWAWYEGPEALAPGLWSIPDPTGEALPARALAQADLVLVPALGVGLDGSRVGTGGGWYDRALRHVRPGTPCWALVNDDEVADRMPREPHDRPVDGLITSTRTVATPGP